MCSWLDSSEFWLSPAFFPAVSLLPLTGSGRFVALLHHPCLRATT